MEKPTSWYPVKCLEPALMHQCEFWWLNKLWVFKKNSLLVYRPSGHAHSHAKSSQGVYSLYIISKSVKQTGGDGGMPRLPSGINRKWEDRARDTIKTSAEFSGWEETFGDWRGLEDYWYSWLHWESPSASSLCLCFSLCPSSPCLFSPSSSEVRTRRSWSYGMGIAWALHQQRWVKHDICAVWIQILLFIFVWFKL